MMTWLNTAARVLSLAAVLPFILRQFEPGDIALYYLFTAIITLQLMVGSGFVPTFARFVTYVLSGARFSDLVNLRTGSLPTIAKAEPDHAVLSDLLGTLRQVFFWLAVTSVPVAGLIGYVMMQKPIAQSTDTASAWTAWGVVILITPLVLYANNYSAFLQGANRIALEQRWSAIFVILGSLSGVLVVATGGGLLPLIVSNQVWQIASFFRLRWLAGRVARELGNTPGSGRFNRDLFRSIWPASWRSLVGVVTSNGVTAGTGLIFAQFFAAKPLAEFLFGLRIMSIAAEISRAPFYSKLPVFNSLRARAELTTLSRQASRGMMLSYVGFIALFLAAPIGAAWVLPLIGSNISFPSTPYWIALGLAVLVERYGAMHIQIYSTTNHIIWHWLNGLTGIVWVALMLVFIPQLGLYAYPVAMFVSYLLIYTQIAVRRSILSLQVDYFRFERKAFIPALGSFVAGSALLILAGRIA